MVRAQALRDWAAADCPRRSLNRLAKPRADAVSSEGGMPVRPGPGGFRSKDSIAARQLMG